MNCFSIDRYIDTGYIDSRPSFLLGRGHWWLDLSWVQSQNLLKHELDGSSLNVYTTLVFWFKGTLESNEVHQPPQSLNMCFFGRSRGSLSDPISNFKWNLLASTKCVVRSITAHNLPSNSSGSGMIMAVGIIVRSSMGAWDEMLGTHCFRMIYLSYI